MRLEPFKNSSCYVTNEVSIIPTELSNLCQYTREKFVTDLAAVSRGKDESKNPSTRYKALLKEAAPNEILSPDEAIGVSSRPLEFLPVVARFIRYIDYEGEDVYYLIDDTEKLVPYDDELNCFAIKDVKFLKDDFLNSIVRFSYSKSIDEYEIKVFTNMRTLYNAGVPYEYIPYLDTIYFKVYEDGDRKYIKFKGEEIRFDDISSENKHFKEVVFKPEELFSKGYETEDIIKEYMEGNIDISNDYKYFKALKLSIPMFIWSQWPMTHTQLSKESQSDRVAENNDYWLPDDIIEKFNDVDDEDTQSLESGELVEQFESFQLITKSNDLSLDLKLQAIKDCFTKAMPQAIVQRFLELCGYKREIWSRAPYYFKLKEVVVTGWYNDPTTWKHSFLERSVQPELWKNWTQKETKQVLECVKQIIEN